MKNILAENMLRFGVKNLSESEIQKLQTENEDNNSLISDENFNKLLKTMKDNSVPAKMSSNSKGKFIYFGTWILWQDTSQNRGYNFYEHGTTGAEFKFAKPYAGEDYKNIKLIQRNGTELSLSTVLVDWLAARRYTKP